MWLVGASVIVHLIGVTAGLTELELPCLKPAVPSAMIVIPPGANVSLPCLEGKPENTTIVHWRFEGQNLSSHPARKAVLGSNLFLSSVYYNASGHYSCHAGGRLIRSHRLVLEEPPETPHFTCHRRSLAKDIICEWKVSRPISPRTKARLWVKKGFSGRNYTEQQCRYYTKSQKFSCRLTGVNNEDNVVLAVSACVVNLAGTERKRVLLWSDELLKPDPPADVVATAMEKAPRKLHVTWRNPYSWGSTYYHLKFQLRYRAENAQNYSEVPFPHGVTSYTIYDALQGLRHTVQVRCREEFNHGSWSEWSHEIRGMPWTELKDPESETTSHVSKFPFDDYFASTNRPGSSEVPSNRDKPTVEVAVMVPLHTFLIMALSVTVGLALVVGIIARFRKKLGLLTSGEGKPSPVPSYSLAALGPEPPMSASPLLSPPDSPFSESSVDSPRTLDQNSPYDVSNADYFLLPK
ncbi:interleukin-6 receptor subunit alpha [Elgaria multicarinata webbii]|uniref:interleukin-6 receptor subunit alpha n=1 Tax=Elgaria multicarinata webbii TaxID=159646 RepID=UPI002FCD0D89